MYLFFRTYNNWRAKRINYGTSPNPKLTAYLEIPSSLITEPYVPNIGGPPCPSSSDCLSNTFNVKSPPKSYPYI